MQPHAVSRSPNDLEAFRFLAFSPTNAVAPSKIVQITSFSLPNYFINFPNRASDYRHKFIMADINLQEIHDFMISIAKQAGERIVSAKPTTQDTGSKKNCLYT